MTKRVLIALSLVMLALPLRADFDGVVRAIERTPGVKRVSIPFLGLARLAVWIVHPEGVHDFELATFEGAGDMDGTRFERILTTRAGAGFQPIVRVHSKRKGEWSFIYARPAGDRLELMLVTHDSQDTVAVRAVVDPEKLLDDPHGAVSIARR